MSEQERARAAQDNELVENCKVYTSRIEEKYVEADAPYTKKEYREEYLRDAKRLEDERDQYIEDWEKRYNRTSDDFGYDTLYETRMDGSRIPQKPYPNGNYYHAYIQQKEANEESECEYDDDYEM